MTEYGCRSISSFARLRRTNTKRRSLYRLPAAAQTNLSNMQFTADFIPSRPGPSNRSVRFLCSTARWRRGWWTACCRRRNYLPRFWIMRSNQMAPPQVLLRRLWKTVSDPFLRSWQAKARTTFRLTENPRCGAASNAVWGYEMADISDYARFLRESPDELARLSKDMLIGVTSFFRTPKRLRQAMRSRLIAPLVEKRPALLPCARGRRVALTGEEVYSLAILMREEMMRNKKAFPYSSSHQTSTLKACNARARGFTPKALPPMSRRSAWPGSSRKKALTRSIKIRQSGIRDLCRAQPARGPAVYENGPDQVAATC